MWRSLLRKPFFFLVLFGFSTVSCGISKSLKDHPDLSGYLQTLPVRSNPSTDLYTVGASHLLKNEQGLWEMRLQGDALQLGLINGTLTQELLQFQEKAFFDKVADLVPSKRKQRFLRKFLAWFNRKMYLHIEEPYKAEIDGLSRFAGDDYDWLAPNYLRMLYLHGAHDIGHAMEGLALVDCSSFATWGAASEDGELIIGRNFDFYAGEDFAKNKIVAFIEPEEGNAFMSVTWPGMIGVVSGMNEHGLSISMNSGSSSIPLQAKTPISLLAREILQYARNIKEAIAIAERTEVFVSESLMIGSAEDGHAILIELSPQKMGVYEVTPSDRLVCSNHFQSAELAEDKMNLERMASSHSLPRYQRMEELLHEKEAIGPTDVADILRDRSGVGARDIGNGNELALNQLIAHHGIIFKPASRQVWVSAPPYQLGDFVAYDLDEVFGARTSEAIPTSYGIDSLRIPSDPFLDSQAYLDYREYRSQAEEIQAAILAEQNDLSLDLERFIALNPLLWEAHFLAGRYHYENKEYDSATPLFEQALSLEIPENEQREAIEKLLKKSRRKAR